MALARPSEQIVVRSHERRKTEAADVADFRHEQAATALAFDVHRDAEVDLAAVQAVLCWTTQIVTITTPVPDLTGLASLQSTVVMEALIIIVMELKPSLTNAWEVVVLTVRKPKAGLTVCQNVVRMEPF